MSEYRQIRREFGKINLIVITFDLDLLDLTINGNRENNGLGPKCLKP